MGGGTEADLTHRAVAAMSGRPAAEGPLRPVLQLAEAPWLAGIHNPTERYGVLLSDGVHSQEAVLAASMNSLVHAGLLRRGSVVRVLDYVCSTSVENRRVVIVIQLEILQTECTLIGSPTIYEVNAVQPKMGPYSDSLGVYRHCMISGGKQGVTKIACSPDQSWLGSSKAARKFTRNTIDAKMHQLSLSSYQGQVPSIVGGFDCPGNTYGHPMQPLYQERPPMNMNRDPVANNEARVMPIAALSPYQGRWTIKARVAGKTKLRYLGKGKVFSFDLLDAHGGQIRATGFNSAVDQFYDQVVAGNVYWISGGFLKPAAKMYNPFNSDYQIILDATTSIEIYSGDDSGIPWQKYSFRQLCEIEIMKNGDMVDLLGVVTSVSPSVKIVRNALETNKRTIQLKDLSGRAVAIILWGDFCNAEGKQLQLQLDSGLNPILALKGGCVNGNDKSVGTTSSSWLKICGLWFLKAIMPFEENMSYMIRQRPDFHTLSSNDVLSEFVAMTISNNYAEKVLARARPVRKQPNLALKAKLVQEDEKEEYCLEEIKYAFHEYLTLASITFWSNWRSFKSNNSSAFKPKQHVRTCFNCWNVGHFADECPYEKREDNGGKLIHKGKSKFLQNHSRDISGGFKPKHLVKSCYNCWNVGHFATECPYEKREHNGGKLIRKDKPKFL